MNETYDLKKIAVVTGGASGLGREAAIAFIREHYRVVINYITERDVHPIFDASQGQLMSLKADVSKKEEMRRMADAVKANWGKVDVLVNNAGLIKDSILMRTSEEDWDRVIDVNLKGVFNAISVFAPLMNDGGHIINISSYSGLKGREGQSAYSASKAALLGLTKSAAIELAGYKIRVNAVLPGYMPTRMGMSSDEAMQKARTESLLKTISDPMEAAGFIVWLSKTDNITGQIFCLDSRIV